MTDCLIIGFNDMAFDKYVDMLASMGTESGAFKDVALAYMNDQGVPRRSMELLSRFRTGDPTRLHNADFLWPVVAYLTSFLRARGFSTDYINLFHRQREELAAKLRAGGVRSVAITTTLYVAAEPVTEIVRFVREIAPEVPLIVGGPYIRNQAEVMSQPELARLFDYLGADFYVISQEGEATLAALLGAMRDGRGFAGVPNLAYRDGGQLVFTRAELEANPLEENPLDYGQFPPADIHGFMSIRTAKSCPFSCAFCGFPKRAGKYKYLGVDLVERELDRLAEAGVRTLTFLDDTFNVPKPRFRDILQLMIDRGYGFRWNSFYRCDHGSDEVIDLMAAAGCEGVFLGAESGSDEMLARMNKTVRRAHLLHAIPRLQRVGISCHANFIIGFPGETFATVDETIDLIERARPDFHRAQLWYADPMTPIWEERERYGIVGEAFHWSHATMDSATAADLVDRLFLSVEGSSWLPQHGFEQWSTFYLQRAGMSLAGVRAFVDLFNAAVRQKLLDPRRAELGGELGAALAAAARSSAGDPIDTSAAAPVAGHRYKQAERYWIDQVERFGSPSIFEELGDGPGGPRGAPARLATALPEADLRRACRQLGCDEADLLATGLAIAASRLAGLEVIPLLVDLGPDAGPAPAWLTASWSQGADQLVAENRARLADTRAHAPFARDVARNPLRLARRGLTAPAFELGLAYLGPPDDAPGDPLDDRSGDPLGELALLLRVRREGPAARATWIYAPSRITEARVQLLARCLGEALEGLAGAGPGERAAPARPEFDDANEQFSF